MPLHLQGAAQPSKSSSRAPRRLRHSWGSRQSIAALEGARGASADGGHGSHAGLALGDGGPRRQRAWQRQGRVPKGIVHLPPRQGPGEVPPRVLLELPVRVSPAGHRKRQVERRRCQVPRPAWRRLHRRLGQGLGWEARVAQVLRRRPHRGAGGPRALVGQVTDVRRVAHRLPRELQRLIERRLDVDTAQVGGERLPGCRP
mmetsp:Transcript_101726/g.303594  ORF Transcript_101726/g.303594 Transcript_101726/m.303594 type:complete len:201 (-) Transcript_101726:179-781(-)